MGRDEARKLAGRSRAAGGSSSERSRSRERGEDLREAAERSEQGEDEGPTPDDGGRGSEEQAGGSEAADEVRRNAALADHLRNRRLRRGGTEDADEADEHEGLAGNEVSDDVEYQTDGEIEDDAKEDAPAQSGQEDGDPDGEGGESEWSEDDYVVKDYWERQGNLLIRHHVAQRNRLFDPQDMVNGFKLEDWCLGHARRTKVITLGGSMAIIDDEWRVQKDCNPGYGLWTGSTTFIVGRAIDQEHAEGDEDEDPPGEEGGEDEEEDEHEEASEEDGSAGRGAGGAEGSGSESFGRRSREEPEPETSYQAPCSEAKKCAEAYVEKVQAGFSNSVDDWLELVDLGNKLLSASGTVENAAKSLWQVREERGLSNLAGVRDRRLDGVLHPDLLAYLREVREKGMAARFNGPRTRVRTTLHPNARKNLDQV